MRNLRTIELRGNGPEDTLFDSHGNVYCSLRDNGNTSAFSLVTGVRVHRGLVVLGSIALHCMTASDLLRWEP